MSARFQDRPEKDLFGQLQAADKKIRKKTKILLPRLKKSVTLSCENIIFITIGLAMSCIICFSLGVEKGRRDVRRVRAQGEYRESRTTRVRGRQSTENRKSKSEEHATENNYVLQLAAFKEKETAAQEKETLRKQGYKADIKKSGEYYQLYIGGFSKKRYAEQLREKLKEKYKDCYIKSNLVK